MSNPVARAIASVAASLALAGIAWAAPNVAWLSIIALICCLNNIWSKP